MVLKNRNIGFFGGSFDPIHIGHLILAEQARIHFSLEHIYFIPVGNPGHFKDHALVVSKSRYNMCVLATESNPFFSVLSTEVSKDSPCYTIDTLKLLKKKKQFQNNEKFNFIVGADSILHLDSWKSPKELLQSITFLVGNRPNYKIDQKTLSALYHRLPEAANRIKLFPMLGIDISSSMIRDKIKHKESINYLLPSCVKSYIEKNNLYEEE
ncbi:MAG: nicotinate-nucleotide adenylyltransferase [Caldisericia bacterium]|nr:nicotinate-nucleotide adenylyltransferase [Caldisericia bacterium]